VTDRQIEDLRFYQHSEAYDDKERATVRFADLVTRGASAIDDPFSTGWANTTRTMKSSSW